MIEQQIARRRFLGGCGSMLAAGSLFSFERLSRAAAPEPKSGKKLYPVKFAVKFGMIRGDASIEEKFNLIKRLGFQGVEMDSPSRIDRDEAVRARDKTGIAIHGVVDSIHWQTRLSDPDAEVRAKGLEGLKTA